jgi:uncharacterized Ntn-hydrolase superfamily protein
MAFAHTYSIVARDSGTGHLGVGVQSHWFAVGSLVPWARAGVGAVATQSFVEPAYGPNGLARMQAGRSAESALADLVATDPQRDLRQVGMIGVSGEAAAWTGPRCVAAAGHLVGDGFCVQANMMTGPEVWPAMAAAYKAAPGDLPARMLAALDAAEAAGGDARGRQSAALVVVSGAFSADPWAGRLFDLRVDDHSDPLGELRRLTGLQRAYNHMNAGDAAIERDDTSAAAAEYAAAEALNPGCAEMVFWHAVAVANAGDADGADRLFRRCFEIDPRWTAMVPRVTASGLLNHPPK